MQAQNQSGGPAEASTSPVKIGDKVSFVITREDSSGFSMSARKGEVIEINNRMARVKYLNGQKVWVSLGALTPQGQPNSLTQALLGDLS